MAGTGNSYLEEVRHAVPSGDGETKSESHSSDHRRSLRQAGLGPHLGGRMDAPLSRFTWPATGTSAQRPSQEPFNLMDDTRVKRAGVIINPLSGKKSGH